MSKDQEIQSRFEAAQDLEYEGDFELAFKIYLELAESGHIDAQAEVGAMFAAGKGIELDFEQAEKFLILPGERGNFRSQWVLGHLALKKGELRQAVYWFEKSSAAGYAPATFRLAMHYAFGRGVKKDEQKTLALLEESAAAGNIRAKFAFSRRLIKGQRGLRQIPRGIILILKACKIAFKVRSADPHDVRLLW